MTRNVPRTKNKVWSEMIHMWEYISTRQDGDILQAKKDWLVLNGYDPERIDNNCFFCVKALGKALTKGSRTCDSCPAKEVEPTFSCVDPRWSWDEHPDKFLAKLKCMDEKRRKINASKTNNT